MHGHPRTLLHRFVLKLGAFIGLVAILADVSLSADASAAIAPTLGERSGFAATSSMLLWGSDADLARDLDTMAATGAKWIRFDLDWQSAEPPEAPTTGPTSTEWSTGARARGLGISPTCRSPAARAVVVTVTPTTVVTAPATTVVTTPPKVMPTKARAKGKGKR